MAGAASIVHVDLDAFYASVEQLLNPSLRGRPVLVGRGVVLAASYEARPFGIAAGMSSRAALARCPQAVVVDGSFSKYLAISEQFFDICRGFTPEVEPISIDEAFLEVGGAARLLGTPVRIATDLRRAIRHGTGLPASVGVARTKFLAKVASRRAKPDGLLVVEPDRELDFLHPLPIEDIWGVGPALSARLRARGIFSVADLAATPVTSLRAWFGPFAGYHLHALSWNRDPRPVVGFRGSGSVGSQSALGWGIADDEGASRVLLEIAERVGGRLRKKNRAGRTITVRVRFPDLHCVTRSKTMPLPISSTVAIHEAAVALLGEARPTGERVTLLGISVSHLNQDGPLQLELPFPSGAALSPGSVAGLSMARLDAAVDLVRRRFGKHALERASLQERQSLVPDEFRQLAERE
jgi:DNA polymerase-4